MFKVMETVHILAVLWLWYNQFTLINIVLCLVYSSDNTIAQLQNVVLYNLK